MFIMFGFGLGFPRIFAVFVVFGDGCAFCPIATCNTLAVPDLQTKQFTQPERQARLREPHFSDFSLSSSQSPKAKDQPKIQVSSFRPPSAKTTKNSAKKLLVCMPRCAVYLHFRWFHRSSACHRLAAGASSRSLQRTAFPAHEHHDSVDRLESFAAT